MSVVKRFTDSLTGFGPVGTAFMIFVYLNFAFFGLTFFFKSVLDFLSLTPEQPWGVVTSIFAHSGPKHLALNILGFVLWSGMFIMVNSLNPPRTRVVASRVFLWTVFVAGLVTNGVQLSLWWATGATNIASVGASGIVYAALGALLALALVNLPGNLLKFNVELGKLILRPQHKRFEWLTKLISRSKPKESKWHTSKVLLVGAFTPALVLSILFRLCVTPGEFFSAGPGIDIFGHAMGFLLGLAGGASGFFTEFRHFRSIAG
jgi:membrane associated rhomboid family serine protease